MRQETQHWNQIKATLEVVAAGDGLTGLIPAVAIMRVSDGLWLQAGGASWGAGVATNNLLPVDAANLPGVYAYSIPSGSLAYSAGKEGYWLKITESDNYIYETVDVHVEQSEWDEPPSSHVAALTMGRELQLIRGLVQGNHRLKNPTYDAEGRMLTAQLVIYPTSADALADTNAIDTFNTTCTYNGFGDLTSLLSRN